MRLLQKGDLILSEIEASWIGYRAQGYQPVFVDTIDPIHAELIKLQRDVYAAVLDRLRPGVTMGELVSLAEMTCAELAPKRGPAVGATVVFNMHGRGAGDDGPLITPSQRRPEQLAAALESNMVFILKPTIRTADKAYECCWGDTVVVTAQGGKRLGNRPHELAVSSD
jgi:Xaa-Pro dipeptidase